MKVFSVEDPVFKIEPLFIVGCSHEQLDRYLTKRFKCAAGEYTRQAGQMFTFDVPPWRVVWSLKPDIAVLVHETFHLVTRICQDKGITIRRTNERGDHDDETAAYMLEFFTRAIVKKLRRWT